MIYDVIHYLQSYLCSQMTEALCSSLVTDSIAVVATPNDVPIANVVAREPIVVPIAYVDPCFDR